MRLLLASLALLPFTLFAQPPASPATGAPAPKANAAAPSLPPPRVSMLTTQGEIVLELMADKSPKSVENFLNYVKAGHYNGTIFHRVIKGFMIQGGGYNSVPLLKATNPPILNESSNGVSNRRGTITFARQPDPNSATAQFFINLVDNSYLNFSGPGTGYAVFGTVVEGMDVVDKIAAIPTVAQGPEFSNFPKDPVVIQKVALIVPTAIPTAPTLAPAPKTP